MLVRSHICSQITSCWMVEDSCQYRRKKCLLAQITRDFYFVSLVTSQALPERRLTCDFYFGSLVTSLTHESAARLGKSASNHL